jgi:translation initiation factor 5B
VIQTPCPSLLLSLFPNTFCPPYAHLLNVLSIAQEEKEQNKAVVQQKEEEKKKAVVQQKEEEKTEAVEKKQEEGAKGEEEEEREEENGGKKNAAGKEREEGEKGEKEEEREEEGKKEVEKGENGEKEKAVVQQQEEEKEEVAQQKEGPKLGDNGAETVVAEGEAEEGGGQLAEITEQLGTVALVEGTEQVEAMQATGKIKVRKPNAHAHLDTHTHI